MSSRIRMSRTDVLIRLSYSTRFFELSTAFKSMSTSSLESELGPYDASNSHTRSR